jgi:hypothetical protein
MPANPCPPLEHTIEFLDGKTWEGGVRCTTCGMVQTMVVTINIGLEKSDNKSAGLEKAPGRSPSSCELVNGDGPAESLLEKRL